MNSQEKTESSKRIFSSENQAGDPFNFSRKLFHLTGLLIPGIYFFNLFDIEAITFFKENTRSLAFYILGTASVILILIEVLRFNFEFWQNLFVKTVGKLLKEKELNRVHGSVPFVLANGLVIGFLPREIAVLSIIFLSLGDPMAAYFGGKYGTIRFYNGKSLQGTLGGIISGSVFGLLFMVLVSEFWSENASFVLYDSNGFYLHSVFLVVIGAIAAFLIEFVSGNGLLDDNMTIPVGSGLIMALLLAVFQNEPLFRYFYYICDLVIPL